MRRGGWPQNMDMKVCACVPYMFTGTLKTIVYNNLLYCT